MKRYINILFLFFAFNSGFAQDEELPYTSYRYHPIVFTDVGFSSAPANIKYPYNDQISKIEFRHNNKMILGLGFSYRWFSLRIGAALIGNFRPVSKFGKTNYFDVGTQFSVKKFYVELDLRNYSGYVRKNAFLWDTNYDFSRPNDLEQDVRVYNVSMKMWYLHNKHFRMDPFTGNRGVYNKQVMTWYLAGRVDFYGINNKENPLIPVSLHDSTNTKVSTTALNAAEFGVIPGFAYVNNIKNFQFGIMMAAGPRVQAKSYKIEGNDTRKAAVVARYDLKLIFGYNVPRFFVMAHIEVDNKSIHFDKFKYNQVFFYFKVQTGYRFKERLPKKQRKK